MDGASGLIWIHVRILQNPAFAKILLATQLPLFSRLSFASWRGMQSLQCGPSYRPSRLGIARPAPMPYFSSEDPALGKNLQGWSWAFASSFPYSSRDGASWVQDTCTAFVLPCSVTRCCRCHLATQVKTVGRYESIRYFVQPEIVGFQLYFLCDAFGAFYALMHCIQCKSLISL